jgi:hypothetical protein
MSYPALNRILEATGYLQDGSPAHGVKIGDEARRHRRGRSFAPDAVWRGASSLTVYFIFRENNVEDPEVELWRREIWNEGFAPLLWVVSPERIELYNGFGRPVSRDDASRHRLRTFLAIERELQQLDELAGRLAMETGQFWLRPGAVSRKTSVDEQLLSDLAALERDLVGADLDRATAQGLIGRSIFTQYLIDRQIVGPERLVQECGASSLPAALRDTQATRRLFGFLAASFNGDMFPGTAAEDLSARHLSRVADFLEAVDPKTGQRTFFPYQFDVIPVELISSIYEQFAHSKTALESVEDEGEAGDEAASLEAQVVGAPAATTAAEAKRRGVHYTRLPVVSLILDEVMSDISGHETVLDLTCGSGVFLVEAFRRLVACKGGDAPSRELIRSTLYEQIYGVDISDAAIRVAAFSLYLAALELDPDPQPPESLRFKHLIGQTLLIGDARDIETKPEGAALLQLQPEGSAPKCELRTFDIVVGNPPWTFRGKKGTKDRKTRSSSKAPRQPRGEGLDFVLRAAEFGHDKTRYGIVLSAMPFFAGSKTGAAAARYVVEKLSPATLVNLAAHEWLFSTAKMPAVVLLAGHRPQPAEVLTVVNVPWSPSAERSHTFEIAPSDVTVVPLASWAEDPERLKAAAFGRGRDMLLLDDLRDRFKDLNSWLNSVGSVWRDGLILGKAKNRTRDASHLQGLEVLSTKALQPFAIPDDLPVFEHGSAQWPRARETYRAPILLIKEFLQAGPRPVTAVAERDIVYTDAFFGAAVAEKHRQSAHLISAVLSSALASWFFLMTASEFGIWKRRLLTHDVGLLPLPDPAEASRTAAGQAILALEADFRDGGVDPKRWSTLDNAVFELYGLDGTDRIIVRDGLTRAGWQWAAGRKIASGPADVKHDLEPYARAFLSGIEPWLEVGGEQHMRAEIIGLAEGAPLRVVRFILEDGRRPSTVKTISAEGELSAVLDRIGRRLDVRLGTVIVGERELRVHGAQEVVIIKPAARRFWMPGSALEDADIVLAESFAGAAA